MFEEHCAIINEAKRVKALEDKLAEQAECIKHLRECNGRQYKYIEEYSRLVELLQKVC
jgi:uncharacterized coiled-coil protein SlyX